MKLIDFRQNKTSELVLRNNNKRARDKNTDEPRNFRKNDPTKVNKTNKPREKVGQSSNNSMGPQCFGC